MFLGWRFAGTSSAGRRAVPLLTLYLYNLQSPQKSESEFISKPLEMPLSRGAPNPIAECELVEESWLVPLADLGWPSTRRSFLPAASMLYSSGSGSLIFLFIVPAPPLAEEEGWSRPPPPPFPTLLFINLEEEPALFLLEARPRRAESPRPLLIDSIAPAGSLVTSCTQFVQIRVSSWSTC